jgi:hypothetical protein
MTTSRKEAKGMKPILDRAKEMLADAGATSTALAALLAEVTAYADAMVDRRAALFEQRGALLLGASDAALEKHDLEAAAVGRACERARAFYAELEKKLASAKAKEGDALKLEQRRAAEAAIARGANIPDRLAALNAQYFELMADIARDEMLVETSNSNLPPGMHALRGVEASARQPARRDVEIVTEERVKLWVDSRGTPYSSAHQLLVQPGRAPGIGWLKSEAAGQSAEVWQAEFVKRIYLTADAPSWFETLARSLSLPEPIWGQGGGWSPNKNATSAEVLAAGRRQDAAATVMADRPRQQLVEYVPISRWQREQIAVVKDAVAADDVSAAEQAA